MIFIFQKIVTFESFEELDFRVRWYNWIVNEFIQNINFNDFVNIYYVNFLIEKGPFPKKREFNSEEIITIPNQKVGFINDRPSNLPSFLEC